MGDNTQPLLAADSTDVEGQLDPKDNVVRILGKTRLEWFVFIVNPSNVPLIILAGMTICSAAGLTFFEAEHAFMHISLLTGIAFLATCGSCNGTVQVYFSISLQEQLEELGRQNGVLAANNEKLKKQCDLLQGTVSDLNKVSDGLHAELNGFKSLRDSMSKYADSMGKDFKETMNQANALYSKMEQMTIDNERTLLFKAAQDLEFLDREAGMSKMEFERFSERIPKQHKAKFQDIHLRFDEFKNEGGVLEYAKIEELIERLLKPAVS